MFEPLQKLLPRAANHYGISVEMKAAKICHDFRSLVPEIFSNIENAESHIQPAHYKNGELTITASSPAFAQEVIMRSPKIIEQLNLKAGKEIIKKLRTSLRKG